MRRLLLAVAVVAGVLVGGARPAAADPARPTNVRSRVTGIVPAVPGLSARVVGGDSFIELTDSGHHDVVVLGYEVDQPKPYLHFAADGTVEENLHSQATYLNRSRYATNAIPPEANEPGAPQWKRVASGGTYAWHDHRTHWMAPGRPPVGQDWAVPLTVDGQAVEVRGHYEGVPAPSTVPWWAVALGAGVGLWWLSRRRLALAAVVVAIVAVLGVPVAVGLARLPATGPGGWAWLGLLLVAAVAGGLVATGRASPPVRGAFAAGAGVALLVWSGRRLDVFGHAILLTGLPAWYDRAAVALALGSGAAALVTGVAAVMAKPPAASTA